MYIKEIISRYGISSEFGERVHPVTGVKHFHNGIDIPCPLRTPIAAHDDLYVMNVWVDGRGGLQMKVYDDKYIYGFAHLDEVKYKPTEKVRKGEVFAFTGRSGQVSGAHLHLTLRDRLTTKLLNPKQFLMFFVLFFLFCSCSAGWHIDRAVIKKSPKYVITYTNGKYGSSFLDVVVDTIRDTIIIRSNFVDTLLVGQRLDTLLVEKERVVMKVYRHYDSVYVFCGAKGDTIFKIKYVDRYIVPKGGSFDVGFSLFWYFIFFVFVLTFFIIISKIYRSGK